MFLSKNPHWNTLQAYYLNLGFPRELLAKGCIAPYEADEIFDLLTELKPVNILEVGTFIGFSLGILALSSPAEAKLTCVDPSFPANLQTSDYDYEEPKKCLEVAETAISKIAPDKTVNYLKGFFSTRPDPVQLKRLAPHDFEIESITTIGDSISKFGPFDFAYVDGEHSTNAVFNDLLLVHKNLTPKGKIALHDMNYDVGPHVQKGIKLFLLEHPEYNFHIKDNLGFLSR